MVERLPLPWTCIGQRAGEAARHDPVAVVQRLSVLQASGLVRSHKCGRTRICSIEPKALQAAERWIARRRYVWERRLDHLERYLAGAKAKEVTSMPKPSVVHATFAVERTFDATPAEMFNAFADPKAKAQWFGGPDDWDRGPREFDFRVGGRERTSGGPKGGTIHVFDCIYQDIVPNQRIIYTYDLHLGASRISVSLTTIEFARPAREHASS